MSDKGTRGFFGLVIGLALVGLVGFWIASEFSAPVEEGEDVAEDTRVDHELLLQVPLSETEEERKKFVKEFSAREGFLLRDLYEKWLPIIGANGIIQEVETLYPTCHDRAHDLGKVIYAEIGDISSSLTTCNDACYSGCMHGVMMEAFSIDEPYNEEVELGEWDPGKHVDLDDIQEKIGEICAEDSKAAEDYAIGDCAHGVGHALMFVANYEIQPAMQLCSLFDSEIMDYYCATGAYMEFVTHHPLGTDTPDDPLDFSPCDEVDYPAACFRYKLPRSMYYHYNAGGTFGEFLAACQELEGNYRLGCMHGFGNAHLQFLVRGEMTLDQLCLYGSRDEQYVCIEGAMERLARYHPEMAEVQCESVEGWQEELCWESVENALYSLDKPFELYLR